MTCGGSFSANGTAPWNGFIPSRAISFPSDSNTASPEADLVFDLRFLPNPYFVEELRPQTGKESAIAEYVFSEPSGKEFKKRLIDFLSFLLPLYDAEGRYRITIALGCTGGKHRSVAMTEALMRALKRQDYTVSVEHRHMELG